jgi:hypothetical protein
MSKKAQETSRGKAADEGANADEGMLDRSFDRWLHRQLHHFFDPVLSERVPDEIMRLLEEFEDRPHDASGSNKSED